MKKCICFLFFIFFFSFLFCGKLKAQIKVFTFNSDSLEVGFGKKSMISKDSPMTFVVNGPLYGADSLPVGGYVDNFHQVKIWQNPTEFGGNFAVRNCVFGRKTNGKFFMSSYDNQSSSDSIQWAIQNGFSLVIGGKNVCNPNSDSNTSRSGIGYREKMLVVIISENVITPYKFAELFIREGCSDAIFLDGGPEVGYSYKDHNSLSKSSAIKLQFFHFSPMYEIK